ncbi:AraC family transcriptional regulator [Diplocloster agilis]|uniref:AraC family transcriptional regulator n=1 Tax=Diplocloster agilis TaxID=2850323 RepID=UPI002265D48C|nr:AraC family transcriptional regulator [Suonthocola fibrivorans]MCU6736175.1 AraC family transcriptional regulator [Suonthocola fibrivorans]
MQENVYLSTLLPMLVQVDSIFTLHYFEYDKNFLFAGEAHDFWEIVYVDSGVIGVSAEDQKHYLKQGDTIFHKPNEFHSLWTENVFASAIIISFCSSSACMDLFNGCIHHTNEKERNLIHEILKIGSETYVGPLDVMEMKKLVQSDSVSFGSEQMIKNLLEQLLIEIARNKNKDQKSSPPSPLLTSIYFSDSEDQQPVSPHQDLIRSILTLLEEKICQHVSLDEIAQEQNFSKSYIKSVFKRETGYTIMQVYFKMKMDKAKQLISEGQYSFTQIADFLGFDSIHSFSKAFKKATGMSPTEYKTSVKNRLLL